MRPLVHHGWVGFGNLRANGHPSGHRWRQFYCLGCKGSFQETHGPPFQGQHVEPDKLVWAIEALAEGLGIRALARVFAVNPNTVLVWLVEAAEHLQAFSRYVLHNVHVEQVQLDELFALLSAVKDGEIPATKAIERPSRSLHWVWVAMDPVTKLVLTVDVGARTLTMAQRVVHHLVQVLLPQITGSRRAYATATAQRPSSPRAAPPYPFGFSKNRQRAAMRWSVMLASTPGFKLLAFTLINLREFCGS